MISGGGEGLQEDQRHGQTRRGGCGGVAQTHRQGWGNDKILLFPEGNKILIICQDGTISFEEFKFAFVGTNMLDI